MSKSEELLKAKEEECERFIKYNFRILRFAPAFITDKLQKFDEEISVLKNIVEEEKSNEQS